MLFGLMTTRLNKRYYQQCRQTVDILAKIVVWQLAKSSQRSISFSVTTVAVILEYWTQIHTRS